MRGITRSALVGGLAMLLIGLGSVPASAAANPHASCVGTIVSNLAPAGRFAVQDFKDIAASGGVAFGEFVAGGARLHAGSLESCLP